ncbi:zinc finger MYM-type protein 4 [Engraulis encrasicolus]|uniref:zinc finger MYM-type protein 4 n=1 Tax=Engraulis encrasicolus TaxID=184585 RepID=UPI002FD5AB0F
MDGMVSPTMEESSGSSQQTNSSRDGASGDGTNANDTGVKSESSKGDAAADNRAVDTSGTVTLSGLVDYDSDSNSSSAVTNGEETAPASAPSDEKTLKGKDSIKSEEESQTTTYSGGDGTRSQEVVRHSPQPQPPTHDLGRDERTVTATEQVTKEKEKGEGERMEVDIPSPPVVKEEGEADCASKGEKKEVEDQKEAVVASAYKGEIREREARKEAEVAETIKVEERGEEQEQGKKEKVVAGGEDSGAGDAMEVDTPAGGGDDGDDNSDADDLTVVTVPVVSEIKEELSMDDEPSTSGRAAGDERLKDADTGLDMGVDMELSSEGSSVGGGVSGTKTTTSDTKTGDGEGISRKKTTRVTEADNEDLDMGVETVVEERERPSVMSSNSDSGNKAKKSDSGALSPDEPLKEENDSDASSDNTAHHIAAHKKKASASDSRVPDAVPAADLRLSIKDEPLDEAYDQALHPFTTVDIKDEPSTDFDPPKLSDEFKISAVYSVGETPTTAGKLASDVSSTVKPGTQVVALPRQLPAASAVCVLCSGCSKVLLKGQTAYQRKGSSHLYCSTACLTGTNTTGTTGAAVKGSNVKKNCFFCLKAITTPKDVITAPVDKSGSVQDFCSQKCLTAFHMKRDSALNTVTAHKAAENTSRCSSCQKLVPCKHEVNFMGTVHKLCSDECFTRYRSNHKLVVNCCSNCGAYCFDGTSGHTLQMDNISKKFCSQGCITAFRKNRLTTVACAMCKVPRTAADMVEGVDSTGKTELFCSATCVTAHRVHTVSSSGSSLACDKCKKMAVPQYHLAMSDGSIRNFCTFNCVVSFQENFNKSNAQTKLNVVPAKEAATSSPASAKSPVLSHTRAATAARKANKLMCRQCNLIITSRPRVVEVKGKMYVVCNKLCDGEFRKASIAPGKCDYCKMDKGIKEMRKVENVERYFCSEGCALLHRHELTRQFGRKHCRQCKYCGNISRQLVKSLFGGKPEEFCSQDCVAAHTLVFCQVTKCANCQKASGMTESLCWLGKMKHFCTVACTIEYCRNNSNNDYLMHSGMTSHDSPAMSKQASPIIGNVISFSSTPNGQFSVLQGAEPNMAVKTMSHGSTQTDAFKIPAPQPPRILKNKALLCKPFTQTKATLCKPTHQTTSTQTEDKYPHVIVMPIPVPVYVPLPMNLYSQYAPQAVGLPMPVPVPMFLPTTLDSAERIVETIQKIKEKIPTDPLEADLILMAEMVAEAEENSSSKERNRDWEGDRDREREREREPPSLSHSNSHSFRPSEGHSRSHTPAPSHSFRPSQSVAPSPSYSQSQSYSQSVAPSQSYSQSYSQSHMTTPSHPYRHSQSHTPAPSTHIDDDPASPPTLDDFDLDALGWDEDLLSDRQPPSLPPPPEPVLPPPPPEEHVDLEADFSIDILQRAAAAAELSMQQPDSPPPPPSKRPRRKAATAAAARRRARGRKAAVVVEEEAPVLDVRKLQSQYGIKAWRSWVRWRNSQPDVKTPRFGSRPMVLKEDLLQCTTAELSFGLCKFISECKRPNGEPYTPDSIYYLCLGIQQHLFENGRMENIFADFFYNKFTQEITRLLQDWQPVVTPTGYVHSRVQEEYLWECKQLGAYSPSVLLYTLFFFCTKLFGLRTVEQHQRLSFAHVMRCTRSSSGSASKAVCLRFYPPITRKDAPKDDEEASGKRKKDEDEEPVLEMQENAENPLRCPVRIYEFYLSKCSPSVKQRTNAFYLMPERCCVPNSPMWFSSAPLDGNALQAMLTRILAVREMHLPQEPITVQRHSTDEEDSD